MSQRPCPAPRAGQGAFSLVELMIAMALLGILAGIATPAFSDMIASQRIRSAADELHGALLLARSEAMKRNGTVTLRAEDAADWSQGWRGGAGATDFLHQAAFGHGIAITGLAAGSLTFQWTGRPDTASIDAKFRISSTAASVPARCLTIAISGMPRGPVMLARGLQNGASLIEVLVALLIAALGLLGLAGLQARAMNSEFESYQRSQALVLAGDMAERLRMNRAFSGTFKNVSNPADGTGFVGTDGSGRYSLDCSTTDHALQALCDWEDRLKGSAEQTASQAIGAMVGARGCVSDDSASELPGIPDSGEFTVAVVWQGMMATAPPTLPGTGGALHCADNLYLDAAGTPRESLRRGVALKIRFARLD